MSALAGGPVQVAFGVDDLRTAAARWVDLGAGPFFVREHIEVDAVRIQGQPGTFDHSSAFGWWGSIMVELIVVHEPTSLMTMGIHHMAWIVDSYADASDELVNRGWGEALSAEAGGLPFALYDARHELGHFVEIYERSRRLTGFYDLVRDASLDWDGADPIRG